jgi:hypothetical protein
MLFTDVWNICEIDRLHVRYVGFGGNNGNFKSCCTQYLYDYKLKHALLVITLHFLKYVLLLCLYDSDFTTVVPDVAEFFSVKH